MREQRQPVPRPQLRTSLLLLAQTPFIHEHAHTQTAVCRVDVLCEPGVPQNGVTNRLSCRRAAAENTPAAIWRHEPERELYVDVAHVTLSSTCILQRIRKLPWETTRDSASAVLT